MEQLRIESHADFVKNECKSTHAGENDCLTIDPGDGDGRPDQESRVLLTNARDGDQSSLWRLTEDFRPYLKAVVADQMGEQFRNRVGDSDVVQQAMTAAIRNFDQFRGESMAEWRAWLAVIAKNEAKTAVRFEKQQKRDVTREVAVGDDSRNVPASDLTGVVTKTIRTEETQELFDAIEQLSEQDREIIRLRNFEALSHTDVADQLGISIDTARKRWSDALKRLRKVLAQ